MIETIANGSIEAAVKLEGAELLSLKSIPGGCQFLWQDEDSCPSGHAPLLFPIVGSVPGDTLEIDGSLYELPCHGFSGSLEFQLAEKTSHSLYYRTGHNAKTLKQFPFPFELNIRYDLDGNSLTILYKVKNTGSTPMPFSIGAHPFFRCPLDAGQQLSDYSLVFEQPETVDRRMKGDLLLTGEKVPFMKDCDRVDLNDGLFERGAVILQGLRSKWVCLESARGGASIQVEYAGFPYLVIWSMGSAFPFVCIEPCQGIDSTEGETSLIHEKEGLVWLPPGETYSNAFRITIRA